MLIPVKFNCVLPTFVRRTFWGALDVPTCCLPKDNRDLEKETTVPVPLNAIACGLAVSESLMATAAVFEPSAVGVKVTEIVQLAPDANAAPQVLVSAKSPGFRPAI